MPGDPDAIALLFTGAGQSGNWDILNTGLNGGRYAPLSHLDAGERGLVSTVSSATVIGPTAGETSLLLFAGGFIGKGTHSTWQGPYQGDFLQLTNWTGGEWDVDLSAYGFKSTDWNNLATHFMVVRTNASSEIRVAARQILQDSIDQFLGTLPSSVAVTRQVVSWDPFPQKQFLSPNQVYLRLDFRFNVDIPHWPSDYQARATFWIRLWAAGGRLNGNVQRWEWWSSGGTWGAAVAAIIGPNVELAAIRINQQLAGMLDTIALPFSPREVYYLPGGQLFIATELVSHTFNDVTIVVR